VTNAINRLRRAEEGFTLIELLVVVAIIALLATFAVPRLFEAINKSKKAPGQADLQTISSALERYYFDNNAYPTGTAAQVQTAMAPYLKQTTTYKNGFSQGYFYGTNTDGKGGYVFIDAQGTTTAVASVCGSAVTWTPDANFTVATTLTTAQITACATPANMAMTTN
jgi:type II secretion system protein G